MFRSGTLVVAAAAAMAIGTATAQAQLPAPPAVAYGTDRAIAGSWWYQDWLSVMWMHAEAIQRAGGPVDGYIDIVDVACHNNVISVTGIWANKVVLTDGLRQDPVMTPDGPLEAERWEAPDCESPDDDAWTQVPVDASGYAVTITWWTEGLPSPATASDTDGTGTCQNAHVAGGFARDTWPEVESEGFDGWALENSWSDMRNGFGLTLGPADACDEQRADLHGQHGERAQRRALTAVATGALR